jgi:hypothetical protein
VNIYAVNGVAPRRLSVAPAKLSCAPNAGCNILMSRREAVGPAGIYGERLLWTTVRRSASRKSQVVWESQLNLALCYRRQWKHLNLDGGTQGFGPRLESWISTALRGTHTRVGIPKVASLITTHDDPGSHMKFRMLWTDADDIQIDIWG